MNGIEILTVFAAGIFVGGFIGVGLMARLTTRPSREPRRRPVDLAMVSSAALAAYKAIDTHHYAAGTALYNLWVISQDAESMHKVTAAFEKALRELQEETNDGRTD